MNQMPTGWQPVVTIGGQVVAAVRDDPARQAWIGFDAPAFSSGVDFVALWANIFRWVHGEHMQFVATEVGHISADWQRISQSPANVQSNQWPGVFKRMDGSLAAVNAWLPARATVVEPTRKLDEAISQRHFGQTPQAALSSPLLLLALIFTGCAAWVLKSKRKSALR